MSNRKKIVFLILLMATLTVVVAGITLIVLYQAAYQEQSKRLQEITQSKARQVEAIALFNLRQNPKNQLRAFEATIGLIREAHQKFSGFGDTGEFTLARKAGNQIEYLLNHRHDKTQSSEILDYSSLLSQPMRLALSGESGILVGVDYRGQQVLAAYEPVNVFNLGIVAKIDIAEFETPFISAGLIAAGVGFLLILAGCMLFLIVSKRLINSAERSESQLHTILNTVVDGIISIDKSGSIIAFNASAEKMFGFGAKEVIGRNIGLLMPFNIRESHDQYMKNYHQTGHTKIIGVAREVLGQKKDGTRFPIDIAVGEANYSNQTFFTGIVRDISQRKKTEQELKQYREHLEEQVTQRTADLAAANTKLEQLARQDALTGIANRRVFDETICQEIRRATREQKPLSLLFCDIDYFKNYNDTYGHIEGDHCLKQVAATIHITFQRAGELVARYGGEEFAIVLPGINLDEAVILAEKLRISIWELNIPHSSSAITDRVTLSLGVASEIPDNHLSAEQLINTADEALYLAKQNGRNRTEPHLETKKSAAV